MENRKQYIATAMGVIIVLVGVMCIATGCYKSLSTKNVSSEKFVSKKQKSFDYLTDGWNKVVRNFDGIKYSDFEIKDRRDIDGIVKLLNTIVQSTNHYKDYALKYTCALDSNETFYIPTKSYVAYLKNNEIKNKVHFSKDMSEEKIIDILKKITNTKYIGNDMLRKIIYLSDFKYYFIDNRKRFIKEGFGKYIKYADYKKYLSKCKQDK